MKLLCVVNGPTLEQQQQPLSVNFTHQPLSANLPHQPLSVNFPHRPLSVNLPHRPLSANLPHLCVPFLSLNALRSARPSCPSTTTSSWLGSRSSGKGTSTCARGTTSSTGCTASPTSSGRSRKRRTRAASRASSRQPPRGKQQVRVCEGDGQGRGAFRSEVDPTRSS